MADENGDGSIDEISVPMQDGIIFTTTIRGDSSLVTLADRAQYALFTLFAERCTLTSPETPPDITKMQATLGAYLGARSDLLWLLDIPHMQDK